jgi:acyl-CoA hydrolase
MEEYKSKLVTAEEGVSLIKSGDTVFTSGNAATPYRLVRSLADMADDLRDVTVTHVLLLGDDPISRPGMEKSFRHNSLFVGPADRAAVNEGRADYVPVFLNEIPDLFNKKIIELDVALIHTSPPDEHGFMSFGAEVLATKAATENAKTVIAQVNEKMPRTLGDCFIHVSKITRAVEVSEDLPELESKPPTDVESDIGRLVAGLVEDGATVQLGIGGIPNAVLEHLGGRRNLGIHTEMVSDAIIRTIESGAVNGSRKSIHTDKVVATFILGSRELYEYVDNNPAFELHPVDYTNDPFVIGQNSKMTAINSAIEVDLTGQVCSDSIGPMIYSGFGGQVDFVRGAARAPEGKPIIALPATAKGGTVSRIVASLKPASGVVTTRADVHYIVTEFGVASLHGKNLRQRAEALIGIAHPDFRSGLRDAAQERGLM